jgi:AraC-like DNA-binding protein
VNDKTTGSAFQKIAGDLRDLVNPVNLFSGARLDEALVADNIVIFKRTSKEMPRPRGVTNNYHHRFVLMVPLEKARRIHVEGRDYMLAPGQVYLVFPHQFHYYLDTGAGAWNWLFITFECGQAGKIEPLRNSPRILEGVTLEMLGKMIRSHLDAPPGPRRNFELVFNLSRLLQRLLEAREASCAATGDDTPLEKTHGEILLAINAYVRANLDKTLTVNGIAHHTGYSANHFRAIFRKQLGVNLGAYIRNSRMSTAAAMLNRPEPDSIGNIAKACGFASIYAFSRAFKAAMGMPPTAYHNSLKTGKIPAPSRRKSSGASAPFSGDKPGAGQK